MIYLVVVKFLVFVCEVVSIFSKILTWIIGGKRIALPPTQLLGGTRPGCPPKSTPMCLGILSYILSAYSPDNMACRSIGHCISYS